MHVSSSRIRYDWWGVVALVIGIYLTINLVFLRGGGFFTIYVIIPILWALIAVIVWRLPAQKPSGRLRLRPTVIMLAIGFGFFQIVVSVFGGIFYGFGESPYLFTPKAITQNFFYIATALAGMELSRAWILNHRHIAKVNLSIRIPIIALVYTFISIPLSNLTGVGLDLDSLQWVNSAFFPILAESMLASYLAYIGGPVPAIVYRGILQAFIWFCPILPNPDWAIKGIIGTAVPVLALVAAERAFASQQTSTPKQKMRSRKKSAIPVGWIATAIAVASIVLFSTGAFGFEPTVIISGSMHPYLEVGDIALVDGIDVNKIDVDDVIKFREGDGTSVVHRVVEVSGEGDMRVFRTKGDANDDVDPAPVLPHQVEGKIVGKIPKVGWLSMGVKELLAR